MHICEVEYKDLQWRGGCDIITWILPIKAADSSIIGQCRSIAVWLSKMQAQKPLPLCRRSFSEGSSDIVTSIFAYKGGQYYDYGCMPLHSLWIIQDARPTIVNAL